ESLALPVQQRVDDKIQALKLSPLVAPATFCSSCKSFSKLQVTANLTLFAVGSERNYVLNASPLFQLLQDVALLDFGNLQKKAIKCDRPCCA
ncbi:MAG TPA: hypothetical protein V6D35_16925, partial [Candidatus Sericytochromatia bacterium]